MTSLAVQPSSDFAAISKAMQAEVDPDMIHEFAQGLGLPVEPLRQLGIGLADGENVALVGLRSVSHAWTFPMVDAGGRVTGLRVRLPGGRKLCVAKSRLGLFVPSNLTEHPRLLFVAEGESDTAAMNAMGFDVVGRPGARNGQALVGQFVQRTRPEEVVVLADADDAGKAGGMSLAKALTQDCASVRMLVTPKSDAREWVCGGATIQQVLEAVEGTPKTSIVMSQRRGRRS